MDVSVPLKDLSKRQLLLHLVAMQTAMAKAIAKQATSLRRLESFMSTLDQSVDDLTAAVDAVGVRFNETIDPLLSANADLRTQVQALLDADVIEDAEQAAALTAAMDAQDAAAAEIQSNVDRLNEIGSSTEEPPVDQPPVDQPPVEDPPADQPPVEDPANPPTDTEPDPLPEDPPADEPVV